MCTIIGFYRAAQPDTSNRLNIGRVNRLPSRDCDE